MLEGGKILVTGAKAGIGFAIAKACVDAGAAVALHARDQADLTDALSKLGAEAKGVAGDLSDPEAPARIVADAAEALGGLDGLVNNAALLNRSTLDDATAAHFDAMFAVNARAPLLLIQAALPHFERAAAQGGAGGAVVNIGSINAHCGAPNLLTYSASKAALMTATRNLGDALGGRPIRINQINVGWTLTENEHQLQLSEGQPEDWLERVPKEFAPRGMILKPEEIAAHAVFWLSERSAPATGQVYELEQYPLIGRNRISTR
ncbi:MAG: SDR family oxidoreductase [Pseudomonadota bacterium]